MALQKSFEMPTGVVGDYWKIGNVHMYDLGDTMYIEADIDFYVDKAASDSFKRPIVRGRYKYITSLPITLGRAQNVNQLRAKVYQEITSHKFDNDATPFFETATEV